MTKCKSVDVGFGSSMSKSDYETEHCVTEVLPSKKELVSQLVAQGKSADEIQKILDLYGV